MAVGRSVGRGLCLCGGLRNFLGPLRVGCGDGGGGKIRAERTSAKSSPKSDWRAARWRWRWTPLTIGLQREREESAGPLAGGRGQAGRQPLRRPASTSSLQCDGRGDELRVVRPVRHRPASGPLRSAARGLCARESPLALHNISPDQQQPKAIIIIAPSSPLARHEARSKAAAKQDKPLTSQPDTG